MTTTSSVLVTGASGFLGGHLAHALVKRGVTPRVFVRPGSRRDALPLAQVDLHEGDLRDAETLKKAVAGVDTVYHCAATMKGSKEEFFQSNVQGVQQFLEAARLSGVRRFVHVSSVAVYGPGQKTIIREEEGYDPFPQQRGYYTWTKIESDRLALQFAKDHQFPVSVLRPGIIYGPGAKPFFARLHYNLKGKAQVVIGHPKALLPLVFVESVVEALILAGEKPLSGFPVYNIVDGAILQGDLLQRQAEAMGRGFRTVYLPPRLVGAGASVLEQVYRLLRKGAPALSRYRVRRACQSLAHDTTKARKELGWRPVTSLPEGLQHTWQWWRQHR
jgi:nucleoside-diphosphate-sugar epimerase